MKALNDQKVRELNEKNKALQSVQQKLESGGSVLNDTARAQLQAEIERQQRDIQRFTEDAQQDLQALQQQLQEEFTRKLNPVLEQGRQGEAGRTWCSTPPRAASSGPIPGMDLTDRHHQGARRRGAGAGGGTGARDGQARRARGQVSAARASTSPPPGATSAAPVARPFP